jgi:hypothetical protein
MAARNPALDDIEEMLLEPENTSATWGSQRDEQSVMQPNDTSDDSDDESGSFTVKQGRGAKKRQRIATSSPIKSPAAHSAASTSAVKQGRGGAPPAQRVSPLVLEGLSDAERSNDMHIASLLAAGRALVKRTQHTKSGTVLVLPKSLDARGQLLQLKLREGLTLRPTLASTRMTSRQNVHAVVVTGVHPSVDVDQLSTECNRKCTRLISAKVGEATWKVKVLCASHDDRAALLKNGLTIGLERHRCVEYNDKPALLQCYKCQGYNHVAARCVEQQKCRKCGEDHAAKDCSAGQTKCANCDGEHTASDRQCPSYQAAQLSKQSTTISYATAARKSADQVECTRLACAITASLCSALKRAGLEVNERDVIADVAASVSLYYRADVHGAYVQSVMRKMSTAPTRS